MNFFEKFKIVAAGFIAYSAGREDISPEYDGCPATCQTYGDRRFDFCKNCPVGIARAEFRELAEAELAEIPGTSKRYTFDYLSRCVVDALTFERLPAEKQTATAARLVGILQDERERFRRVKAWNEKHQPKT